MGKTGRGQLILAESDGVRRGVQTPVTDGIALSLPNFAYFLVFSVNAVLIGLDKHLRLERGRRRMGERLENDNEPREDDSNQKDRVPEVLGSNDVRGGMNGFRTVREGEMRMAAHHATMAIKRRGRKVITGDEMSWQG